MGLRVFVCEQCHEMQRMPTADLLLPEVVCSRCGHITIYSPEAQERTRNMLAENSWYAGFLELLLAMEEQLGIDYADEDFPAPFVTPRQLIAVTLQRCHHAITEPELITLITRLTGAPVADLDSPLSC
ncbi:hypothetical protein FHW36_105231 [Chitinophaga polysaccharea]|uniref:Uncharacterized protein n=1 Tax=Chitinophaga polysaccharea TaxID=1293035 RepID=A0A561PNU5_9BACT|nr:hypothetical protein [Chitinophaga polysaccharea]TWF39791.1 hypothetical protein FHW36_105231 [Chitinophaga polysaccharea]